MNKKTHFLLFLIETLANNTYIHCLHIYCFSPHCPKWSWNCTVPRDKVKGYSAVLRSQMSYNFNSDPKNKQSICILYPASQVSIFKKRYSNQICLLKWLYILVESKEIHRLSALSMSHRACLLLTTRAIIASLHCMRKYNYAPVNIFSLCCPAGSSEFHAYSVDQSEA